MRARGVGALALVTCAGVACDAIYGIQQLSGSGSDAGIAADGSARDAAVETQGVPGTDGAPVADGGTGDGEIADDGGDAEAGRTCRPDGSVAQPDPSLEWAEWPMPNATTDVEAGAPHPQGYTDDGDGTIVDDVTGLMWQQVAIASGVGQSQAMNLCASQTTGHHCDWRLPTYIELASIVDVSVQAPAIDGTYFLNAGSVAYWSSSAAAQMPGTGWVVSFTDGHSYENAVGQQHHARCVRGVALSDAGPPPQRYVIASGTARDLATGLVWQQATASASSTWSSARGICAGQNLGGLSWRLPTMDELVTIVDVTQIAPAIDSTVFTALAQVYWTSTPVAGSTTNAWGVDFNEGASTSMVAASDGQAVRCVH